MNELDWSQAPEDADKYNTHNSMFYKGERPYLQVFIHEQWKPSVIMKSNELFVYRPTTPSWSGEGLPPVGVVCEATDQTLNDGAWTKVVILAVGKHGKDDCVLMAEVLDDKGRPGTMVASLYTQYEGCFRPIRTPEQIAAGEREAAIDEMLAATPAPGSDISLRVCEKLYDAGYRKP